MDTGETMKGGAFCGPTSPEKAGKIDPFLKGNQAFGKWWKEALTVFFWEEGYLLKNKVGTV